MIAIFKQARHAKVEQLHMAPRRNQHVRWFQIAMHHQLRMRIRYGLTNFANQRDARLDCGRMLSGIVQQRHALHIFKHQKRLPEQPSRVDQPSNAGMIEPRE